MNNHIFSQKKLLFALLCVALSHKHVHTAAQAPGSYAIKQVTSYKGEKSFAVTSMPDGKSMQLSTDVEVLIVDAIGGVRGDGVLNLVKVSDGVLAHFKGTFAPASNRQTIELQEDKAKSYFEHICQIYAPDIARKTLEELPEDSSQLFHAPRNP
jgi:hypothetical protein